MATPQGRRWGDGEILFAMMAFKKIYGDSNSFNEHDTALMIVDSMSRIFRSAFKFFSKSLESHSSSL